MGEGTPFVCGGNEKRPLAQHLGPLFKWPQQVWDPVAGSALGGEEEGSQAAIRQQLHIRISGTKPKELKRKGLEYLRL